MRETDKVGAVESVVEMERARTLMFFFPWAPNILFYAYPEKQHTLCLLLYNSWARSIRVFIITMAGVSSFKDRFEQSQYFNVDSECLLDII